MKKVLIIGSLVVVGILIFGAVGVASAATLLPRIFGSRMLNDWESRSSMMYSQGTGTSMMGGGRGGMRGQAGDGLLHDYMIAGFAEAFDLTVDELQVRLDAGETMYAVATSLGYTQEQFSELMVSVRTDAIAQAVADGVITQEQADWMLERMSQRQADGYGTGVCPMGGGGGRGAGRGACTGGGFGGCTQP